MGQFTVALIVAATFGNLDCVRVGGRWFEPAVRRAVHGAALRLADPACGRVLTDFRDRQGRPTARYSNLLCFRWQMLLLADR